MLFQSVQSEEFKDILRKMGGYDVTETGVQRYLP
jgi:hypothetical protein